MPDLRSVWIGRAAPSIALRIIRFTTPVPLKPQRVCHRASFGPTTAGRMDSYVDAFQSMGASLVMIAKGNRSAAVTEACKKYGGFYLGSIGGPAAILAHENIKKVEPAGEFVLEWRQFT